MKVLYILRHGKSSWADAGTADFDRPLTKRGQRAARQMGREAARRGWVPDAILCSPARRTKATLELFEEGWTKAGGGPLPDPQSDRAFYLAEAAVWLRHIRHQPPHHDSALIIGHNPGLKDLAVALSGTGESGLRDRLGDRFPTCALAMIAFEASGWDGVTSLSGRLTHLLFPRDLDQARATKD